MKPTSGIRVVFFDIGNVLLRFSGKSIARKLAFAVGRHPLNLVKFLWNSKLGASVERGEIPPEELYRIFKEELGYEKSYASFKLLWSDHFTLNRATHHILKRVAKIRKVYLLSNTNHLHYEFISRRYSFPRHVHGAILSHEVRMRKPEPGIYKEALRLAGVKADEALFIDDLKENVEAARKLGIRGHHFQGVPALRRELSGLGLL